MQIPNSLPRRGLGALLLAVCATTLLWACEPQGQPRGTPPVDSLPPARIPIGEELVVVGFVGTNQIDCHRDAPCALHLDADGQRVVVLYDRGKGDPPCGNEASTAGLYVERGAKVEVFGLGLGDEWISTCDSPAYYVHVLLTADEARGIGVERVLSGVVIENERGYEIDLPSVLRVRTNGEEVDVLYASGEWPPCDNRQASRAGSEIEPGQHVEVFGRNEKDLGFSTCRSEAYYILALP